MRPQRKRMLVETTYAFVKLKQIKAAVSAGGINFLYWFLWFFVSGGWVLGSKP